MYERSAIVLERYLENLLKLNTECNIRKNYKNFLKLIDETEKYLDVTTKEGEIIQEFDEIASEIQEIQKRQEKLCQMNQKLEIERNKLFEDLSENISVLESKLKKIENNIDKNNEELKELRERFLRNLADFMQRQKERNKCEKERRLTEANHIKFLEKINEEYSQIEPKIIIGLKSFINSSKDGVTEEIKKIMVQNGKNEKVGFNENVLKKAIISRIAIAEKEAECYITIYEKMKRFLAEVDNDNLKIEKYKKISKSVSVKLAFLNAEKEYIFGFLDYERMTVITGAKMHEKMMEEACKNFELDIIQIENLYELLLMETQSKATKKAYKELYNKNYLKNIEDKEKNFEEEITNININVGTVINSNYWRIDGIKNIYNVFQYEISSKYEKDLSEYSIEENEKVKVVRKSEHSMNNSIIKENTSDVEDYSADDQEDRYIDDNFEIGDYEEESGNTRKNKSYHNDNKKEDKYIESDESYEEDEEYEEEFFDEDEENEEDDEDFYDEDDEYEEDDEDFYDEDEENEEDDEDFYDEDDEYEEDDEDFYDEDEENEEADEDFYDEDDEYEEDDEEFYDENKGKKNNTKKTKNKRIKDDLDNTNERKADNLFEKFFKDRKGKKK